ncbi:MAG: tyrosine-type recombinase/integrase [Bacteroidota bacterium]
MISLENYVKEKYSPKSAPGYLNLVKKYTGYMGAESKTAKYKDVLNYIGHLRLQNLHPKSLINYLFAIKIYYSWLNETGQRKDHPCRYMYLKDQVNKRIQVESLYSRTTLEELLNNHQSKNQLLQKRDEVIISLLIYQALTVQEISALNLTDVDLKQGTIKAKGGYKQKARTLSLQASQILLMHQYITEDREKLLQQNKAQTQDNLNAFIVGSTGERVFSNSINRIINTGKPPHEKLIPMKIRQSVLMHLLKSGHDLRIVQVFAGHNRAATTEEYKQTGLEELKTLIQKLHPLDHFTNANDVSK